MFQDIKLPDTSVEDVVPNDGFWPALSVEAFQRACRIPVEYNATQQREALIAAAAAINQELMGLKVSLITQGFATLADTASQDKPVLYRQAVHTKAKASLLVHFATMVRRDEAQSLAKESPDTFDVLLAQSQMAVRTLLARPPVSVRLL